MPSSAAGNHVAAVCVPHTGGKEKTQMSTAPMPSPQAVFYQQYEAVRRDEIVGILLALFLGTFGIHHFYLRRTGLGILYCCFFWSGIPAILGFIECFFMPARVREFNAIQAAAIAASLGIPVPAWGSQPAPSLAPSLPPANASGTVACARCQTANPAGARFCSACGGAMR